MAIRRSDEATFEVVDGKAMLIDPAGTEILTLNRVGTLVWEALDGCRDLGALVDEVMGRVSGVTRHELERDVAAFLRELSALDLVVEVEPEAPAAP